MTFIIVFLRYMLDTSVNVEGDLESQFDIPVLGSVPRLKLVDEPENGKRKNK